MVDVVAAADDELEVLVKRVVEEEDPLVDEGVEVSNLAPQIPGAFKAGPRTDFM